MVKKQKDITPITLSKDNLLYQPLSLAVSGYSTTTAFQQNVVISVLRKLKNAIKEMRDFQYNSECKQLTLFETDNAGLYKSDEEYLSFDIHMSELGVSAKHYQRAFDSVCRLADVVVWVPDSDNKLVRDRLFKVAVNESNIIRDEQGNVVRYQYLDRSPRIELRMSRRISNVVFNPKSRIYDFLDDTAMMIPDNFPKRMYMYLSNSKYLNGGLTIGYWKFRKQIGFDDSVKSNIRYPRFYDFKKYVLDNSKATLEEMARKNLSDFWFEYEPIYECAKKSPYPEKIHFTIHLSEVGKNIKNEKSGTPIALEIEKRLQSEFELSPVQSRRILDNVEQEQYEQLTNKMDELTNYFSNTKTAIKSKRSYANKVLLDFISCKNAEHVEELNNDETNMLKSEINKQEEPSDFIENLHIESWSDVISSYNKKTKNKYSEVLRDCSYLGMLCGYPYVSFSNKKNYDIFINDIYDDIIDVANEVYELGYTIRVIKIKS